MSITLIVSLVLVSGGVCMGLTSLAYAKLPERRVRPEPVRSLKGPAYQARVALNATLSAALVVAFTHLLASRLFYAGATTWWRGALEALAILVLYDFLYYFLHRFPFHRWSVLHRVHAVHHRVRFPTAIDSTYLHPVENFLGLSLLTFCTWVVGPVSVYSFGVCFFVYSWLNIIVHCGVALPGRYFAQLSRKHDLHHRHMRAGNFASLSPIPDLIFRHCRVTREPRDRATRRARDCRG